MASTFSYAEPASSGDEGEDGGLSESTREGGGRQDNSKGAWAYGTTLSGSS